ncbi:FAD dependent oxidoreductase OS=Ureibacillus acetophenoni OX=614649 GN=SAMN05877842_101146 PE=4 SV=1 [Ureibacillus acetophenoni]
MQHKNADFAAMSKVPFFIGREDIGNKEKNQTVDYIIHLNDVNWDQVLEAVSSEKFGPAEHTNNEAWGFPQLQEEYIPVEENTQLRGLNIVKIENDYYLRGLQIVGVNGLDVESKKLAIEKGKVETENILAFLQGNFPGFEQAKIAGYPTELYISETRHILAEYQLTMIDVWTNRDQWDNIGLGAYPAKVQALTPQDQSYVIANPKQYAIPFRSLVPKEIDGLLVVGRSAGFSSLAASSARVVPTGMVTGEAAGVAAAIVTGQDLSFRELSKNEQLVEYLRTLLAEQGAIVDNFESDYPYQGEWYDESIQILINYGLVYGGYTNDLEVDELATRHRFINLLKDSIIVGNPELDKALQAKLDSVLANELAKEDGPLLLDDITNILSVLFIDSKTTSTWQKLIDQNIIREEISSNIPTEVHELTNKEIYAICAEVFNYIHQ